MSISTKIDRFTFAALATLGLILSTGIHQQVNAQTTTEPTQSAQTITTQSETLNPNQALKRGKSIVSKNQLYKLTLQDDGNLVLTKIQGNQPLWASGTDRKAVQKATMQADGNLVLTGYDGKALWASNTNRNDGSRLVLQDDGNLVIYTPSLNRAVWATNTETKKR